ncbi:penicillin-binding protein 1A [Caldisalinibacter kiritimatiensis]|uniref:Multimodular transpeptidase-transglycosylase n=1 Tax=Caldisalinibacter kiritimatiensis TaxID=1304284 RepID=R1AWI4_9FIRM|nr:PBP1A family penicillin-binding protein [Caldisalinibacter kiritimatiensis]EOD01518.1 Multimodular transpeptidase-transglycosylase [Caldisalinibacter kiritimatiensis]
MSQSNRSRSKRTKNNKKKLSISRLLLVIFLLTIFIVAGATGGLVLATVKNAPKIDPTKITTLLNESSEILDANGNVIEKVHAQEYREIVTLDKIPDHLENAFIAIEDQRFRTHIGIDPKRIIGALIENIKAGTAKEGGSTITQQLVKNLYLTKEKKLERKIKEAYLAIQLEKHLTKDQILEAYLNTIELGQGSCGVQAAAHTYFSKDVSELTIAESAMIAGAAKGITKYAVFNKFPVDKTDSIPKEDILGYINVAGNEYAVVFNHDAKNRQKLVLRRMKELGFITEEEYNQAINEDMRAAINPGEKKMSSISSYFTDFVKQQVIKELVKTGQYTDDEARKLLYTGGLKIYSTIDMDIQYKLENIYDNFTEVLFGDTSKLKKPVLEQWGRFYRTSSGSKGCLDKYDNLVDHYGNIIYYKKANLFDKNYNLIIEKGTYSLLDNGSLLINNKKFNIYPKTIDIVDYYSINEKKNLVTHTVGSLALKDMYGTKDVKYSKGKIIISSNFLKENKDFYRIDKNQNLLINPKYFPFDYNGIVQPQSASVIIDYRTGEIKALVGGRNIEGSRTFNRATSAQRQPGSSIKPLAVYLPALDNGFTAASIIDDIPHYDNNGNRWPKNWYDYQTYKYWGLTTLREAVEYSINVAAVKVLENIGIDTSIEYLTRLGIINEEKPESDSFVTRSENRRVNDETIASLSLGGMTHGLTPLEMTAAYGAIANNGIYVEPISFTKVIDGDGRVILEKKPTKNSVVTPQVAYVMSDILESTVSSGLGRRAMIDGANNTKIPVAGKTGTTQNKGDIWFVGYTPYYAAGVWIGNDNAKLKLSTGSSKAAEFWSDIMKEVHKGLEPKNFVEPDGLVRVNICTESGKRATELCKQDPRGSTTRTELFIKGTEPIDYCDTHVEAEIDTTTGKLANEFCPPELIEKRVFIRRNPPYAPDEHNGYVPRDYQYTVPTEYCDIHTKPEETEEKDEGIGNWMSDWYNNFFNNNEDTNQDLNEDNIDSNTQEDDSSNIDNNTN